MTREEAIKILNFQRGYFCDLKGCEEQQAFTMAIKALEQEPLDVSNMLYDIFMEGVNMTDDYQGLWVRFKDIETIVNKYTRGAE